MNVAHGENRSSCLEPELLAAYLDRRLTADERSRVEDHLAGCEACYDLFADSARFRLEEEAAGEEAEVVPIARPRRRLAWAAGLAAAAALAAALLWTPWLDRLSGDGAVAVLALAPATVGEPFDGSAWSVRRSGAGYGAGLGPRALSLRAGVRSIDLVAALDGGDAALARSIVPELTAYVDRFELSQPIVAQLEVVALRLEGGRVDEAAGLAREAVGWLDETADPLFFPLGAWSEAGRMAAAAGDAGYFERPEFRRLARRLREADLPAAVAGPLAEVDERLAAGVEPGDLPSLEAALRRIAVVGGDVAG